MSKNFNNITITGHLVADAELKEKETFKVCNFRVAVNRDNDVTDFFSVKVWNKYAETLYPYLKKGKYVLVNGEIHVDEVTENESRRWFTSINADTVNFLSSSKEA